MKKSFLFFCDAYIHRKNTSYPFMGETSEEINIKGNTPEWIDKMNELQGMLGPDESIFVIKDKNFDHAIHQSYILPAIKEYDKKYDGKMVMNGHLFILYVFLAATAPTLFMLHLFQQAGLFK
jgi:hypothetical protein